MTSRKKYTWIRWRQLSATCNENVWDARSSFRDGFPKKSKPKMNTRNMD